MFDPRIKISSGSTYYPGWDPKSHPSVWKYKVRRHFLCSPWCLSKDNEVVESPSKKGGRHVDVVLQAMV